MKHALGLLRRLKIYSSHGKESEIRQLTGADVRWETFLLIIAWSGSLADSPKARSLSLACFHYTYWIFLHVSLD